MNSDGANPYLTATVSGTTITLTDKIKTARQFAWVLTPYDANKFAICNIRGGIDGTLIGSISAGLKSASTSSTKNTSIGRLAVRSVLKSSDTVTGVLSSKFF